MPIAYLIERDRACRMTLTTRDVIIFTDHNDKARVGPGILVISLQ